MKQIKFILLNIKLNLQNAKELRSSFIISILGMALNNVAFLFLWYYFGKTVGILNGWRPIDVFGLYGFNSIAYGITAAFFAGILKIPTYIISGNLDKFLSTPKNTLMKIATSSISTSAIGDLLFGIVCFIIFAFSLKLTTYQLLLSLFLQLSACIIFFACVLVAMSISFYLMDGENVSDSIYGLFLTTSLYHGGAFQGLLRLIFIFVVPSLLIGSVPVETVHSGSLINIAFIVLISIFWLLLSIIFFYKSLRKYDSNNFFGFSG